MGRVKADASKKAESKVSVKRKAVDKPKKQPAKKVKAAKDPNKPKRPPSAFFVFMEEFRAQFKAENPDNKQVSAVGKAAGAKWKDMSASDKQPYEAKAAKKKADYDKSMSAYNKTLTDGTNKKSAVEEAGDESDKSKSEVHDEEDGDDESGEGEEDDD